MRDLLFIAVVVGFFAVATIFVAGCERLVGHAAADDHER
jgi:hypothetical protein